nr:unnamed protein product [Digitaria exilis]
MGWKYFVETSRLLPDYVVAPDGDGGCYTIMCRIIVVPGGDPLDVPPPDMGTHLARLMDSGEGSDVSFVVGGETFPAHRAVLAAHSLWPISSAEIFNCPELKKKCFGFFAKEENLKKSPLTDDFVRLRKKFPSSIDELKEKTRT